MKRKASVGMLYLITFILLGAIIALTSCNSTYKQPLKHGRLMRATILENMTTTWCRLNPVQDSVIKSGDIVWLRLDTHTICDTSNYTMKAVLTEVKEIKPF